MSSTGSESSATLIGGGVSVRSWLCAGLSVLLCLALFMAGGRAASAAEVGPDPGAPVTVTGRAGYLVDGVFQPASRLGMVIFTSPTADTPTTTVQADRFGQFTATVIAGATYTVNGSMSDSPMGAYTYNLAAASSMEFAGGEVLDLVVPTSQVTVQVRDPDGQPVSGASISTSSSTMNTGAPVVQADQGGVSGKTSDAGTVVTHIPTGAHLTGSALHLPGGLSIPQTLPDITGDLTFGLTAPATASVTGRMGLVVDGVFQPPTDTGGITQVRLTPQAPNTSRTSVSPDSLGHFTATVIAGDSYQVSGSFYNPATNQPPSWAGSVSFEAASGMVLAGGEVLDLAIPTSRVTVHVRDAQGRPVTGASINIAASTKDSSQPIQSVISGKTAATGTFGTIGDLVFDIPTGASLSGSKLSLNGLVFPQSFPDITSDTTITVTPQATASVTGRLGFVVDGAFQSTIPGGRVTFTQETPNTPTSTAQPDSSGRFTASVNAGTAYTVAGFVASPAPGLSATFEAVAPETFAGGEVVDLAIPTSRLAVTVRDKTGHPLSGASISTAFSTRGTGQPVVESQGTDSSATTSAAGTVVTHLPTGAHLTDSILRLSGGLALPVTLPDVTGDVTLLIRYDSDTGTVTLPPVTTIAMALLQGPQVTDVMIVSATVRDSVVVAQTPTGTVQFSYTLNGGPTLAVGAPVPLDASGVAVLSLDQGLPHVGPGPYRYVLTAAYTPTPSSQFTAGVSAPVLASWQGNDIPCTSGCPDPQAMVATVPAGSLVISTPYTAAHPFDLGTMTLNENATELSASAPFGTADPSAPAGTDPGTLDTDPSAPTTNGVTITDARPGDVGWTASAQSTDFTGPAGNTTPIPGDNLSFTGVTPKYLAGNGLHAGSVSTNDITAFGATAKPFARTTAGQGPGTVNIYGTFGLTAATSTRAGAYGATVTFTIA
jgi:hypothetical protein